ADSHVADRCGDGDPVLVHVGQVDRCRLHVVEQLAGAVDAEFVEQGRLGRRLGEGLGSGLEYSGHHALLWDAGVLPVGPGRRVRCDSRRRSWPEGPKRSTRTASAGTPRARSSEVAWSAKPVDPQTYATR